MIHINALGVSCQRISTLTNFALLLQFLSGVQLSRHQLTDKLPAMQVYLQKSLHPITLILKLLVAVKLKTIFFTAFRSFLYLGGGSAVFADQGVDNIISRVTGGSISNIQGLIEIQGNANFFLINPNGIIFGRDARLDIRGSFLATTANRINFADGRSFSAAPQTQPLLSVSTPIGLQFGASIKPIDNQSQAIDSIGFPAGLEVDSGRTLALVGGDITIESGLLTAPGGRIELGSVDDNSLVSLTPVGDSVDTGWRLGYENVQKFRDIRLLPAIVSTESDGIPGNIYFRGRNITINQSQIQTSTYGTIPSGIIAIQASESVEVSDGSQLLSNTYGSASFGNINIETQRLLVSDGSFIDASTYTEGRGGNITVNSPESVEVRGNGQLTQIATQAYSNGDAGELKVTTGKLILSDGGQIASSTVGVGNGGKVTVEASESIAISGQGKNRNNTVASGLLARTLESATGDGGELSVNTGRLIIRDGGSISAASVDSSTGQAGNLDINAVNSVEVSGAGSSLQASSVSPKSAGNLTITTDKLVVQDGARVNVSSTSTGDAGNLTIAARTISLDNQGQLTSTSTFGTGGGNIILQDLESLTLRGKSEISTNAGGEGNGGDITIRTKLLTALENSKITANAEGAGKGGNIQIETQGFFVSPNSQITASSEQGIDGVVEIDRLENDPEGALLTLPAEPVNISGLIAQGCSSGSVARNSKFVVTGRGGLPPTPKEAFRGDVALADLGNPVEIEAAQAKVVAPTNQKLPELTPLVEAQGWVIGSKGEVILTGFAPNVTPSVPWMKSNSCHG